jgi:hypothetical protein
LQKRRSEQLKVQRKVECFEAMESKEEVVKLTLGLW